ncbi:MAG: prephenate dehydrogenase/arogenate dehydrogenase family protein [Gammaproteobacteria bacterium]|jgi:chorismate mutase/prephenate dehydrogenase|nr:prephenate dehydrogenase/arogenate dehydrogenase family protein [Gammaproteobacteria bacterium]
MDLKELRDNLSALDRQILDLVAQRQAAVMSIGEVKRQSGQTTRNFAREKQVIDMARAQADELGIPPNLAEALMELLIRSSLTKQEHARVRADGHGHGHQALVIGGGGRMGLWFVDFLDSQGFEVTVADPINRVDGFRQVDDWSSTDDSFDITVIAAPIGVSAEIIDKLAVTGRKGLIFDIGSLKSPLEAGLQKLAEQGLNVTSLHPMFGPDTELLSGSHVLFLDVGVPEATRQAQQLFASTMARQIEMDIGDHDRLIAFVLGLSHALNIAFFTSLAESGENLPRLSDLSSTTFDAQLKVAKKVGAESPELYFEIQRLNPHGLAPLHELASAVQKIIDLVESGDEAAFVALMHRGRDYIARHP